MSPLGQCSHTHTPPVKSEFRSLFCDCHFDEILFRLPIPLNWLLFTFHLILISHFISYSFPSPTSRQDRPVGLFYRSVYSWQTFWKLYCAAVTKVYCFRLNSVVFNSGLHGVIGIVTCLLRNKSLISPVNWCEIPFDSVFKSSASGLPRSLFLLL